MIGRNLQEIDQNLEVLSNVVQHNQQRNTGGEISQSLREIIAQLHVLDRAQPTAVQIETAL